MKASKKIKTFVLLSVLFHLLLLIFFWMGKNLITQKPAEVPPVWVTLKPLNPKQIADISKPQKEERPDKAQAESLYNQKVKEETVSTTRPLSPSPPPPPLKGGGKEVPSPLVGEGGRRPGEGKIPGMPETALPAPSSSDDFLPNYKVGDRTYINTLANPNIGYYVELKRKYRLTWNPVPSLRGQANEISRGKIDVVLGVSVNRRGELVDLIVIRSSGIAQYDTEGMRAIRDSSPYSSPPANLLSEDGQVHMAWTFVVYL